MFKKVIGFSQSNPKLHLIDKRFEYFQHYWSSLSSKFDHIFFHDLRFESHRTLIKKIEYQLAQNFRYSFDKFNSLFVNHPYFQPTNIIAKKSSIKQKYQLICNTIEPTPGLPNSQKKRNYSSNRSLITDTIKKIKTILFDREPYNSQLAKKLIKILSKNKPINPLEKKRIKFLINAFYIELFHYGYDLKYIHQIPEILFKCDINDFPFEKTKEDFQNETLYIKYKENELANMNANKLLWGLVNLVNRVEKEGYYVFKIENIELLHPNTITIGDVSFYNPQINQMMNIAGLNKSHILNHLQDAENFHYSGLDGKNKPANELSKCNAIVKTKYRASSKINSSKELYIAFDKVRKSLSILSTILNNYGVSTKGLGKVELHKHFRLQKNKKMSSFGPNMFLGLSNTLNINPNDEIYSFFTMEINRVNNLHLSSNTHNKIFTIQSTINSLLNQDEFFNFKDLWIAWEALLTNKDNIIDLAKDSMYIMYKKNYLSYLISYLHMHLTPLLPNNQDYQLTETQIKRLGIGRPLFIPTKVGKFKNNYHLLNQFIPTEFISEIQNQIASFIHTPNLVINQLNKWIENTINDIYIERNTEVHSNLKNDFSKIKLKKNFMRISNCMVLCLIQLEDKRNPDNLSLTLNKIKTFKNRL